MFPIESDEDPNRRLVDSIYFPDAFYQVWAIRDPDDPWGIRLEVKRLPTSDYQGIQHSESVQSSR